MQLSLHSDYALRALLYLGAHPGAVISTSTISEAYGISKNHLVRVLQTLHKNGYVELLPGRSGGVRLAQDPAEIRLGDVVRHAEPNMRLVECFDKATNTCPIHEVCYLKSCLTEALQSFLATLNQHNLAELLAQGRRKKLESVFVQLEARPKPAVRPVR